MEKRRYQLKRCSISLTDKAYDAYCGIHPLDIARMPKGYSVWGAFQVDHMTENDVNDFLEELYDLFLRREDEENEN